MLFDDHQSPAQHAFLPLPSSRDGHSRCNLKCPSVGLSIPSLSLSRSEGALSHSCSTANTQNDTGMFGRGWVCVCMETNQKPETKTKPQTHHSFTYAWKKKHKSGYGSDIGYSSFSHLIQCFTTD